MLSYLSFTNQDQIWHDLYHGKKLDRVSCDSKTQTVALNLFVEAGGYGALSATLAEAIDENIDEFLAKMNELSSVPLHEYSNVWTFLPQEVQDLELDTNEGTI